MCISEFACGVIAAIGVEIALIIAYAIYTEIKKIAPRQCCSTTEASSQLTHLAVYGYILPYISSDSKNKCS